MSRIAPGEPLSPQVAVPIACFCWHAAVVVLSAVIAPAFTWPSAAAGDMMWIFWLLADFPLGWIPFFLPTVGAIFGVLGSQIVFGGLQWAFWGWFAVVVNKQFEADVSIVRASNSAKRYSEPKEYEFSRPRAPRGKRDI